ncbi:MAG TPA: hypothetical protein VIF62_33230 [Labilithrix sp.]
MRFRFLALGLAAAGGIALAIACGEDSPSIPDVSQLPDATPVDDSGGGGDDAGIDAQPCTPPERPDDTRGIFVSTAGADGATCGTRQSPCRSIAQGIARAGMGAKSVVYIAQGQYDERVKLAAGIELNGGWLVDGITTDWAKACGDVKNQIVVLHAPKTENVTVEATNLVGDAGAVTDLTIETKAQSQVLPSESIYGLFVVGAATEVDLTNVILEKVSAGGNGADGKNGDAGADGGANCTTAGTGAAGTPGTNGTGAAAGSFDPTGYTAAGGTNGAPGGDGQNGTAAPDPPCVACGACAAVTCAFTPDGTQSCGTKGSAGCAGIGGTAGNAATGGGSSIAIYCYDAIVKINGGRFTAGNGGSGGIGGSGGAGGKGAPAARGANGADCTVGCNAVDPVTCNNVAGHGDAGLEGGVGGPGGAGGNGGGGAGGWSIALFQGGTGQITPSGATLAHGTAGKGGGPDGGAGTPGTAADRYP